MCLYATANSALHWGAVKAGMMTGRCPYNEVVGDDLQFHSHFNAFAPLNTLNTLYAMLLEDGIYERR